MILVMDISFGASASDKKSKFWAVQSSCVPGSINSHYFHIIGDGHQPNSRGLYIHYQRKFS